MKLTEKNRKIITYVLYFLSIILVFQIYNSIDAPIEFNKVKNERYQKVIERLKDIRNAQVAFKSVNGIYSDNFDSLVNFIETGQFTIIEKRDSSYTTLFFILLSNINYFPIRQVTSSLPFLLNL